MTPRKLAHLVRAARHYLATEDLGDVAWRIDFVAVELNARGELLRVELIQNAVEV
jgi:Holliday junction resolvase-like predicted endonuclease